MSLGIAFKGPEGIVLAADSRVTLSAQQKLPNGKVQILPAFFDNANKLLRFREHKFVGAVTYGAGAFGQPEPRTAHSFLPEFEAQVLNKETKRLGVEELATALGDFFGAQWSKTMPPDFEGPEMIFLVGGYDQEETYGRVFTVEIPGDPRPVEKSPGEFGMSWGGQLEITSRLINGFDPRLPSVVAKHLDLDDDQAQELHKVLKGNFAAGIPYQFLSLQDCVDLSILLIKTTAGLQRFQLGVRGVGGAVDVATITRTEGFVAVQEKVIRGEVET